MIELVLSLFPGGGLLDMAFEAEGFCVVAGPDLCWGRDCRTFHPPAGRFDGMIGGPPCQPFSPLVHLVRANGHEPKHPNLIPEFERIVREGEPAWFLMEEVPQAPLPAVDGYAVHSFVLHNTTIPDDDGLGQARRRARRFSFGVRGTVAVDLRRWIQLAALELPEYAATVTQNLVDDTPEAKGRLQAPAVRGKNEGNLQPWEIARLQTAALGGSGKVMRTSGRRAGYTRVRSWEECCALQGLPADWLKDAPFTKAGKFQLLGNGVPIKMGRAIARAVKRALGATS